MSTLLDTTSVDMNQLSSGLLSISSSYGIAASEMTQAAYNAVSSYTAFANDVQGLNTVLEASARLAAAGFTDIDTATSATLKTMNAYRMGIDDIDQIQRVLIQTQNLGITTVDELGRVLSNVTPTAAAMGVSFEQVGAALATMTAQGTPAAQATTQLNAMFVELGRNGTQAAQMLAEATQGTQYAGMSFQQLQAAGVPLNQILDMMSNYANSAGLSMMDMFSSAEAGRGALQLCGQSSETFANNLQQMSTQADVVGEAFDQVSNTSAYSLQQTLTSLQNILISLFQAFSPIIRVVLDLASTLVSAISSALTPFMEAFQPIIDIIATLGNAIGQFISGVINQQLNAMVTTVRTIFDTVVGIFRGVIEFITGVFTGNWQQAWDGIVHIFQNIWNGIANIAKIPINFIIDGINSFIRGVNAITIPDWVPGIGGAHLSIPEIPRLKVGMDYVPSDDFPALLHKGEAVLTAAEAAEWRGGAGRGGLGTSAELEQLAEMIARSMSTVQIPVYLDGNEVGRNV